MGISGLLQEDAIKKAQERIQGEFNLKRRLGNKVAGIDGHNWLHRAVSAYGDMVALNEAGGHEGIVRYFMDMLRQLLSLKIIPLVVFDGMELPAKTETNTKS